MKKLWRFAWIACAVVIALAAGALTGVNLYVQSQGTQARIQQELSRRLGAPLTIRSMSVTPWGGLQLSGIAIPQASPGAPGHFLEAKTFRLRVNFLSLFSRRMVIKEVALINPTVVWPQDAEGKWRLPKAKKSPEEASIASPSWREEEPSAAPPASTSGESLTPSSWAKQIASKTEPPEGSAGPMAPEVRRFSIKNGNFTFLDQAGALLASFSGVEFRTSLRSALALRGDAKVAKVSLRDRFFLEQLRSPLRYEPDVLELSRISARVAHGMVNGYFAMQLEAEDSPFTTSLEFHDVRADEIVANAGGRREIVHGKLEGKFRASGKTTGPESLMGSGEISLREGRVQQYSLLMLLGEVLQIEELRELHLEQADARFHLKPGLARIDELVLRSPNLRLTASGTVAFDGRLKLQSQLAISDKIRDRLFRPLRQNFQPAGEAGYSAVNFQIGGTLERPSTNLVDKLVGRDLSSVLDSLLGGKKQRTREKKKQLEEPAPAAPSSLASPEATPLQTPGTLASPP